MTIQVPFLSSLRAAFLSGSDVQRKNLHIAYVLAFFSPLFLAGPALAENQDNSDEPRFEALGERLVFNGHVQREDGYDGIEYADARELRQILRDNPSISVLKRVAAYPIQDSHKC